MVVALVVLGVGGFALWKTVGSQSSGGSLSAGSDDPSGSDGSAGTAGAPSCSLVATEDVAAVLGGEGWTVLDGGSTVLKAYDSRVLAGVSTSCVATDALNAKLARIARYQGGDAAARFAEEKQKASRGGAGRTWVRTSRQVTRRSAPPAARRSRRAARRGRWCAAATPWSTSRRRRRRARAQTPPRTATCRSNSSRGCTHRDPPMTTPVGGGGTATSDRSGGTDV